MRSRTCDQIRHETRYAAGPLHARARAIFLHSCPFFLPLSARVRETRFDGRCVRVRKRPRKFFIFFSSLLPPMRRGSSSARCRPILLLLLFLLLHPRTGSLSPRAAFRTRSLSRVAQRRSPFAERIGGL